MNLISMCGLLMSLIGAAPEGSLSGHPAVELQYTGTLTQVSRDGGSAVAKQFDAYIVLQPAEGGRVCFSVISEQGGGGWSWPERFGRQTFDTNNKLTDGRPLHVLHDHDGTKQPVELPSPVFEFASKIKPDATWTSGKFSYEVGKKETVAKRECFKVDATDSFGRRESVWIEAGGSLLVSATKRIFMGRGDEFRLKLDLASSRTLDQKALGFLLKPLTSLGELQKDLQRQPGETKSELSDAQLAVVKKALPSLTKDTEGTPLKNLVLTMSRDTSAQSQRVNDIASIASKLVGQSAPEFAFTTLTDSKISSKTQKDRITVLHFWDYKDAPLEEPYGQVGYLDYINNRRKQHNVDVIGVAVNEGFGKPETTPPALRSVRKLRDFMNLSYPIAMDNGDIVKKFGDPRGLGAKLPVWVVIDGSGKVAHYNVGLYSVKPDEGLKELDAVVMGLIRKQRAKE